MAGPWVAYKNIRSSLGKIHAQTTLTPKRHTGFAKYVFNAWYLLLNNKLTRRTAFATWHLKDWPDMWPVSVTWPMKDYPGVYQESESLERNTATNARESTLRLYPHPVLSPVYLSFFSVQQPLCRQLCSLIFPISSTSLSPPLLPFPLLFSFPLSFPHTMC